MKIVPRRLKDAKTMNSVVKQALQGEIYVHRVVYITSRLKSSLIMAPAGSAAEQRNSSLHLLIDTRYRTLKGRTRRSRAKDKVESRGK